MIEIKECYRVFPNTKKKYLDRKLFNEMSRMNKCEAVLWLMYPLSIRLVTIGKVAGLKKHFAGGYVQELLKKGKVIKTGCGLYKLKDKGSKI